MTAIPAEHRAQWREWAERSIDWPTPDWLQNILDTKPATVETETSGQYFTLCDAAVRNEIIIRGATVADGQKHGCYTFRISYSEPEPPKQQHLFDL